MMLKLFLLFSFPYTFTPRRINQPVLIHQLDIGHICLPEHPGFAPSTSLPLGDQVLDPLHDGLESG